MKLDLNGIWSMSRKGEETAIAATLPGTNYEALMESGALPDVFSARTKKMPSGLEREIGNSAVNSMPMPN